MALGVNFIGHAPSGSGTSFTYSLPSYSQTAGHCIVVGIEFYTGTGATFSKVSDTAGNTSSNGSYALAVGPVVNGTLTGLIYYAKNCLGSATNVITVTLAINDANFSSIFVWDISGASLTAPLDQTASSTTHTSTHAQTPAFTTLFNNEVIVGFNISNPSTASAADNGATFDGNDGAGANLASGSHSLVSSIQANYQAGFTLSSAAWLMSAATFTDGVTPSAGGSGNSPAGNVIFDLDSDGFPILELQTGTDA